MTQPSEHPPGNHRAAIPSAPLAAPIESVGVSGGIPLQQNSVVLDVEVLHHGIVYRASYFVERGIIHAKIGNGVRQLPLNDRDAAATVKSHLIGYLHQVDRKRDLTRIWSSEPRTTNR